MEQSTVEAVPRHQGSVGQRAAAGTVTTQQVAQSSDVERSQLHRATGEEGQLKAQEEQSFDSVGGNIIIFITKTLAPHLKFQVTNKTLFYLILPALYLRAAGRAVIHELRVSGSTPGHMSQDMTLRLCR